MSTPRIDQGSRWPSPASPTQEGRKSEGPSSPAGWESGASTPTSEDSLSPQVSTLRLSQPSVGVALPASPRGAASPPSKSAPLVPQDIAEGWPETRFTQTGPLQEGDEVTLTQTQSSQAATFKLGEHLGKGRFADVYATEGGAMKVVTLLDEAARSAGERGMLAKEFEAEVAGQRAFNSPYIIKIHAAGVERGSGIMVQELARGSASDEVGEVSPVVAAGWFSDLMHALAEVHKKDMVFRDLKLENLLIVEGEGGKTTAKLSDFGYACSADQAAHDTVARGTCSYLAPEILAKSDEAAEGSGLYQPVGGKQTSKSDIWAAGILLYELLASGTSPYGGRDSEEVINNIGRNVRYLEDADLVAVVAATSGLTKAQKSTLVQLSRSMLKLDPNERPTADQVLEALQKVFTP